ncbi:hypothetical protein CBR_g9035 [Chara braunii]|uniref:CCHC-type domain-containing protein n=1 Tax=Chara braunii TaxID=69332 RepID=A0A388KNI7_CHABU|nr:hypothetical protein CBR_g9035 [Chara braunii]|eukprot:GBG71619.1 hypothetical protein CBR_g9035 [Chara braunii]
MPDADGIERGPAATPTDFVKALEKGELARLQVPKIDIFHFKGDRVSEWLELLEQVTAEVPEEDKFKFLPRYIWWETRPEVMKVAAGAGGGWAKFKAEMQRRFKLGDGLLTKIDLEMLQRDEFSTVGAFATAFEKMAKKVPGLAEEEQKKNNVSLSSGTSRIGKPRRHLFFQMRQARKKRKALDATTSDGRDFKRMIEDAVGQLDAEKEGKAARKAMAASQTQGKAKKAVVQEEEEEEKEEPEPQKLTKAQRKAKNLAQGGQGSGRGQTPQATALPPPESHGQATPAPYGPWPGYGPPSPWPGHCSYVPWPMSEPHGSCAGAPLSAASCGCPGPQTQQVSHSSPQPSQPQQPTPQGSQGNQGGGRRQNQGWGRGQGNGGRGGNGRGNGGGNSSGRGNGGGNSSGGGNGDWDASRNQSSQDGGRGFGRGRIDWRNAICWHCGQKGHTIKFCHVRRNDEDEGLISTNYDADMYDKFGYYIDPEIPGGSRKEALRRVEAGELPAPPAMFRIWQEEEVRPNIRVEEIGENEEVEQKRKTGTVKEEPIVVESDEEIERGYWNEARRTMERMEDLVAKMRRYQDKLTNMCEEVKEWKGKKPLVYLYDMGPAPQGGSGSLPGVTISGPTPRSGMAYRPPSRSGGAPQAVRTRAKGLVSPGEDERDERLRREEDKRAELRAKKRDVKADTDKAPEVKKRKYVVRVEEGYDVEEIMDKILEGHNHLMNLKDVLASAPRLRDELKARLSRKMVASVRLGAIIPKEAEWAETGTKMDWKSVACGCLDVVVKGKTCTTMVDTGTEMNLIKKEHALRLGMEVDRSDNGVLIGANSRSVFIGTASRVVLEIGKVKVRSCFFVMPDLDHPILLGRSFMSRTETVILNKHDGTMFLVLCDPNIAPETRVRGFLQFVRRPIRMFVKSIVERALHWGDCKRLLRSYYTPTRLAEERRSMEKNRKEPEVTERRTFELGMTSGTQRDGQWREHMPHGQERGEEQHAESVQGREEQHADWTQQTERQGAERTQRGGPSSGSDAPPQPAQDCPMADKGPELPQEPHGQEQSEEQVAREKEQDRKERAAIEREIRVQIRLKNIAELHEKVEQGEQPVILEDRKRNDSPTHDDETPLFTEAWDNFDKLLEAAGRPREQHQEMGVKLVSTDLLSLNDLMKEGFAVAKTSDEKMEKRLTRVARASHEQRMDWQKEIGDLKKELERQDKEMKAMKTEMEKAWAGNVAIRQVNQTLNKVNDTLRTYLQVQQNIFHAKEAKWEKRIEDLEAKCAQQAPTAVVDWTEVQGFEIRKQPAEEALKSQKVEERANEQRGEEIPLLDKKMLEPQETLAGRDLEAGEFEWRMPTVLAHEQGPVRPGVRPPTEVNMDEATPPMIQRETVGQQEAQESVGQARVEAEVGEDLEVSHKTPPPQDMPLVAGLEEALGCWATGSGAEERVSEQVAQTDDRAACPIPPEHPQQEVTSEATAVPSFVPSQGADKMEQKKFERCFYCKRGKHPQETCPKSLKDEANGLFSWDPSGVRRDKYGNLILKTRDGIWAQLYRQLHEDMSDQG